MTKIKFLGIAVAMIFFLGCGSENDKTNSDSGIKEEAEERATEEKPKPETITAEAEFIMMIANTAGTSYFFKIQGDDEFQVFPDENLQGMEFTNDMKPGDTEHEYYGKKFKIKYEKREFKTNGGDIVDRFYLTEIKKSAKENANDANVLAYKNIKNGDVIEGLKVTKKEYQENDHYNISFSGDFTVTGSLFFNEYEEMWSFGLDEESKFKTKIKFDARPDAFDMCTNLGFSNINKLLSGLDNTIIKKAKTGERVRLNILVKNLSVGATFDKGLLGYGSVDFVRNIDK